MSTARRFIPEYTVDDYRRWEGDWELWNGVPVAMTPSPFGRHSKVLVNIVSALKVAIDAAQCDATVLVELDWILAKDTVLRPDALVVCGKEPPGHLERTPAIVVEVLSESTRDRDLDLKKSMYAREGVPHYLTLDPDTSEITAFECKDGVYSTSPHDGSLALMICEDCEIRIGVDSLFR